MPPSLLISSRILRPITKSSDSNCEELLGIRIVRLLNNYSTRDSERKSKGCGFTIYHLRFMGMDKRRKIILYSALAVCVVLGTYLYIQSIPPPYGKYDAFAQCIDHTSTTFYGAWWCPHCQAQKAEFGDAVKYLPYVECANSDTSEKQSCIDLGINSYPTWYFPDGTSSTGLNSLANISEHTNCSLSPLLDKSCYLPTS